MSEIEVLRNEVAQLRAEMSRVDDWANGVFGVLEDFLPLLLRKNPDLAEALAPMWKSAAERFAEADTGQSDDFAVTPELLEARKMLYRKIDVQKGWPRQE